MLPEMSQSTLSWNLVMSVTTVQSFSSTEKKGMRDIIFFL